MCLTQFAIVVPNEALVSPGITVLSRVSGSGDLSANSVTSCEVPSEVLKGSTDIFDSTLFSFSAVMS